VDVLEDWAKDAKHEAADGKAEAPKEEPHATNVCWTTIPVGDLARAKQFYTGVFNFQFQAWKANHGELFQAPGDKHHKGHIEISKERIQYPAVWLNVPGATPPPTDSLIFCYRY
jgi:catechol-2,3-dioxygenase